MTEGAECISPEDALRRAFWMVKLPSMTVLLAPLLTYAIHGKLKYIPTIGSAGLRWFLPAFLGGFVSGWLVRSIQVPRWRLRSVSRRCPGTALLGWAAAAPRRPVTGETVEGSC